MPLECSWETRLADHFSVSAAQVCAVSGGSAPAYRLESGGNRFFIKRLESTDAAAAEADGLAALSRSPFRVPRVMDVIALEGGVALVLEWLALTPLAPQHRPLLVSALCELHRRGQGQPYGWDRDNFIGQGIQLNGRDTDWARFFVRQRLAPQLSRAQGLPDQLGASLAALVDRCDALLPPHPAPALLHGDLWRGNLAWCEGRPALFDPAVYVGDAAVDLAMLKLFGEPVPGLVSACRAHYDNDGRWPLRERVYDLYHLLNHYNLFGAGWLPSLAACCRALLEDDHSPHESGS